ncbi:MAG TPA: Rieske 2Fe-2S domain-containing protein [Methylibium sp.]|nr:Rieske 2Fe-2S domain-containing protein [Methylibium sp.]
MAEDPSLPLCRSEALAERGRAHVWDVLLHGQPARAFALRIDGRPVAYLNRCAHVSAEMDWNPGDFLDGERRYIVCALHGAHYEPSTGRCAGGPCGRGRLAALMVTERDGEVRWYPSQEIRPAFADEG